MNKDEVHLFIIQAVILGIKIGAGAWILVSLGLWVEGVRLYTVVEVSMFTDLLFDNPLITYRGRSRREDVVACLREGNLIFVNKARPSWWPWKRQMSLGIGGSACIGRGLFDDLIRDDLLESHGETYYERIYRKPLHVFIGSAQ